MVEKKDFRNSPTKEDKTPLHCMTDVIHIVVERFYSIKILKSAVLACKNMN